MCTLLSNFNWERYPIYILLFAQGLPIAMSIWMNRQEQWPGTELKPSYTAKIRRQLAGPLDLGGKVDSPRYI
jgi:hypothetical protein